MKTQDASAALLSKPDVEIKHAEDLHDRLGGQGTADGGQGTADGGQGAGRLGSGLVEPPVLEPQQKNIETDLEDSSNDLHPSSDLSIESDSRNGLQPFRDNLADSLRAEELSISNDSSTAASEIDTNHEETGTTDPLDASKKDN